MKSGGSRARIAVIGSGGIGGVTAGLLAKAGHEVTLCVRRSFDQLVVETAGKPEPVPATIATTPDELGPADWVFVTTKAQDTAGAAAWLGHFDEAGTRFVVMQNGVEQAERLEPFVHAGEVVPAIVYIAGERKAPGHIVHLGSNRVIVPAGAAGDALASLLEPTDLALELSEDFKTLAWRKLLSNVTGNPITALTLRRLDVMNSAGMSDLVRQILTEAVAVAQAEGARLGPDDIDRIIELHAEYGPSYGSSMLYDRLAGLPTEHEHLTGAVVRHGELHGVPTPVNQIILTLLRGMDVNQQASQAAGG